MSCRRSAVLPLQALALSVGLAAGLAGPAAAQSVRDTAIANCLDRVNVRTGGNARVVRSSSGRTPIVTLTAPGDATFICQTNAQGEPVRVRRTGNSNR